MRKNRWAVLVVLWILAMAAAMASGKAREGAKPRLARSNADDAIETLRRERIDLLGRKRLADSSDDDDEAATFQRRIDEIDGRIAKAERKRASERDEMAAAEKRLPGGLEKGLVFYFPFDVAMGAVAVDLSGRGNAGHVHGARWSARGRSEGCLWLDGKDDYVEVPTVSTPTSSTAFTVSVCVLREPTDTGSEAPANVVAHGDSKSGEQRLWIAPTGAVGATVGCRGGNRRPVRMDAEPARERVGAREWAHLVLTMDGRVARTYVNGRLDKTMTVERELAPSHRAPWQIGRCGAGDWAYGFTGRIDDVIVWDRALSEVEVMGLWVGLKSTATVPSQLGGFPSP